MGTRRNDVLEQGSAGGALLTSTGTGTTSVSAVTGVVYGGIKVIEDTVINSGTWAADITDISDIEDNVTLSAGDYIPVRFTAIAITSGTIIIYKEDDV